jgi:hypothetical protein
MEDGLEEIRKHLGGMANKRGGMGPMEESIEETLTSKEVVRKLEGKHQAKLRRKIRRMKLSLKTAEKGPWKHGM